jgi:hypothetical protein
MVIVTVLMHTLGAGAACLRFGCKGLLENLVDIVWWTWDVANLLDSILRHLFLTDRLAGIYIFVRRVLMAALIMEMPSQATAAGVMWQEQHGPIHTHAYGAASGGSKSKESTSALSVLWEACVHVCGVVGVLFLLYQVVMQDRRLLQRVRVKRERVHEAAQMAAVAPDDAGVNEDSKTGTSRAEGVVRDSNAVRKQWISADLFACDVPVGDSDIFDMPQEAAEVTMSWEEEAGVVPGLYMEDAGVFNPEIHVQPVVSGTGVKGKGTDEGPDNEPVDAGGGGDGGGASKRRYTGEGQGGRSDRGSKHSKRTTKEGKGSEKDAMDEGDNESGDDSEASRETSPAGAIGNVHTLFLSIVHAAVEASRDVMNAVRKHQNGLVDDESWLGPRRSMGAVRTDRQRNEIAAVLQRLREMQSSCCAPLEDNFWEAMDLWRKIAQTYEDLPHRSEKRQEPAWHNTGTPSKRGIFSSETEWTQQQKGWVEEMKQLDEVISLYLRLCFMFQMIATLPSLPAREVFENPRSFILWCIGSYPSAHEPPGRFAGDKPHVLIA